MTGMDLLIAWAEWLMVCGVLLVIGAALIAFSARNKKRARRARQTRKTLDLKSPERGSISMRRAA